MFNLKPEPIVIAFIFLFQASAVYSKNDLDEVTMRVIGLDEIPVNSFQIQLPGTDLEGMADINEAGGTTVDFVLDMEPPLTTPIPDGDAINQ